MQGHVFSRTVIVFVWLCDAQLPLNVCLFAHTMLLDSKQFPVEESLVCGLPTDKQVKNQSCLTGQAQSYLTGLHLPWVLPLRPISLGNHQFWEWGALSQLGQH